MWKVHTDEVVILPVYAARKSLFKLLEHFGVHFGVLYGRGWNGAISLNITSRQMYCLPMVYPIYIPAVFPSMPSSFMTYLPEDYPSLQQFQESESKQQAQQRLKPLPESAGKELSEGPKCEELEKQPMFKSQADEMDDMKGNNYPKKNTESNIINQVFSFLNCEFKTGEILLSHLGSPKKVKSFYQIMSYLKKSKKKYVNRKYFERICLLRENEIGYKMLLRVSHKLKVLTVQEFQRELAVLIIGFLKNESEVTILTSRKMNRQTTAEHLMRRRQICSSLLEAFRTGNRL